ncbi:hypothetical protein C7Y66_05180 [Chroococcidiopsis sp. CCALA 051]|uniref:hypothetical protein n=1 Tax=Chroococcidiopsis sp. CCALA 051 TaxID=869949 RepID=UPI000D0DC76C|nr:hypothetical protein [Chroococcidiopsis sp. CCALA 051]MBE9014920.1 hypothetical protein [Chroococcidiopsidales cyanobacterium LEGE 13417]PSM50167.1 hypothetical protein C7Y66_05180 [Chroococcidiopsis sp. CCALA 051]
MSTREEAREAMTQQRQQEENLQQSMLQRTEAELADSGESEIQQSARERMTAQRQQEEHLQQSMLSRSATEVGLPTQTDPSVQTQ